MPDLLIDRRLLVEIKSVERLTTAHSKQLLTYLRLTNQLVRLLINFEAATLKEGVRRVVNGQYPLRDIASPRESTGNVFRLDRQMQARLAARLLSG